MFLIVSLANSVQIPSIDRAVLNVTYTEERVKPSFVALSLNVTDLPFLKN